MSNRIVSIRSWLILLLAMTAIAGCGDIGKTSRIRRRPRGQRRSPAGCAEDRARRDVLRIREDLLRNRLWVLTPKEVRVYNTATTGKRLIRKIALPNWSVVGFRNVCMPDMALDRAGSAFISSNGQARLLRIDADRFDAERLRDQLPLKETGWILDLALLHLLRTALCLRGRPPGECCGKLTSREASATMTDVVKKLPADQCAITTQPMTTQLLNDFERS